MIPVAVLAVLRRKYGTREWKPHYDPIAELVLTILSQNTSDKNSRPAFQNLKKRFPRWEQLLKVDVTSIAKPIESGGLANIKAERIQSALREIFRLLGALDLDFLVDLPLEEAREWLVKLPGVGFKTAACVLLFALGKPAMPVDTHVHRVATRLGIIPLAGPLKDAHRQLEKAIPPEDIHDFHILMIEHGRQTCSSRRPKCQICVCQELCKYYKYNFGKEG